MKQEEYTGAGRTISKRTPHSLDREDGQDFVICCRTYSNSNSSDSYPEDRRNTSYQQILGISISIRSEICYWIAHSMSIYALKRTRTSTLFSTRFWVSRVYHFTIKAWILFHEYDIYIVWYMEYMTKVESWSISIDHRLSYIPESDIKLLRLELSGGCRIYIRSIKKMYNQTYFSIP